MTLRTAAQQLLEETTPSAPSPTPIPSPLMHQSLAFSPATANKLQSKFDNIQKNYNIPGIAGLATTDKGSACVCSGVRKYGTQSYIQPTDLFHIGSCTKSMTATLVAIFVERGLLTWDSLLPSIFPEIAPQIHQAYRNIPIKLLTSHRSGITGDSIGFGGGHLWRLLWNPNLSPVDGRKKVVLDILSHPPSYVPGTKTEYSNYNFVIVGAILERLTGRSWESLIKEELWTPLGMTTCGFGAQGVLPNQPWPHKGEVSQFGTTTNPVVPDFYADNPPTVGPAGTVHCSLQDWEKFIRFHINGFNGVPTPLLSPPSFKILHEQFNGDQHTAGGWLRVHRGWASGAALTHAGSNTMNYAVVWVAPKKKWSFVVACNIGSDTASKACDEGVVALLDALKEANA